MIRVECHAQLVLRDADGREACLTDVAPLLALVDESGSIAQAAALKGLSYRHAWGLLRDLEARLGAPLIANEVSNSNFRSLPFNVVSSAGHITGLPTRWLASAIDSGSAGPLAGTPR